MNKLVIGVLYAIVAQVLTFLQLQGNVKYNWLQKYPYIMLGMSIPICYLFIKSVENIVAYYDGRLWESRFWGFSIGIFIFIILSKLLFNEPFTTKTAVSLVLSTLIVMIQIFWK